MRAIGVRGRCGERRRARLLGAPARFLFLLINRSTSTLIAPSPPSEAYRRACPLCVRILLRHRNHYSLVVFRSTGILRIPVPTLFDYPTVEYSQPLRLRPTLKISSFNINNIEAEADA